MALKRMDNVGIVVDDLAATIEFFRELGLELEGRATIEGEWAGRVTGLGDQRVEIAMMRTPDGHSRLELSRFLTPPVVEDLEATVDFFRELGLELEGRGSIEGEWAGRVTGLGDQHVEVAMMRTPDGHSRLELSRFLRPSVVADHRTAPVNALGYLRVMFAVDDLNETLERLYKRGAQLVGEVVDYQNVYRLCYIRGPEGLLIGLAQELG